MSVDDTAPHTVTIHVDITAALSPKLPDAFAGLRVAPSFRFALFDGRRVTTEAVGGAGWDLVSLPHSGEETSASVAHKNAPPTKPVTAEKGAKGAPAGPSVADAAANGALVRHRTVIEGFVANADAARMIGASPALFFFCNVALSASAPPAAHEKGKGATAAVPSNSVTQRPWAFWVPLDASPLLLDDHSVVSVVHGSRDALLHAVNAAGRDDVDFAAILGAPLPAFELSVPTIFSFLSVHVRVATATAPTVPVPASTAAQAPAPAAAAPAPAAKGAKAPATAHKGAAPAASAAPPAPTSVVVNPPRLLSHGVRNAVNPLRVVLHCANALPGLSLPEGSDPRHLAEFFSPDAFEAQRKYGRGTYAVVALPFASAHAKDAESVTVPDAPPTSTTGSSSSSSSNHSRTAVGSLGLEDITHGLRVAFPPPRCAFTPSLPPGRSAVWQSSTVVCAGAVAPDRLRESFESSGLCVRVHDRDCDAYEAVQDLGRSAARGRDIAPAPTDSSAQSAPTPIPVSTPVKGGKAVTTPANAASSTAPPATQGLQLGPLVAALLPRTWPWPRLSGARLSVFESMLAGTVKHPNSSSGAQLVPWWTADAGTGAAAAAATTTPATAVTSPKGKAPAAAAPAATPAAGSALPDIFLMDSLLIAEVISRLLRGDDVHPHGVATLRLDRLLSAKSAADVASAAVRSQAVPISAAHRAIKPKTFEPTHLLSRGQAMLVTPGDYCGSGSCVKVSASLAAPLQTDTLASLSSTLATSELLVSELGRAGIALSTDFLITSGTLGASKTAAPGAIERLVLIFPYNDDALMLQVITAVAVVNSRAVPTAASLQAHVFSAQESAAIAAHELDVITGIHVTDGLQRIFILEGLGGMGRGMESVRLALPPRPDPSDTSILLLSNALVRFQERLYPDTGLALRNVRLARPLADIAADKGVYNVSVSPDSLRAAISALCSLSSRDVSTLAMARQMGALVWPPLPGLTDLQLKHGAALSLIDVYGRLHPAAHALGETSTRLSEVLDFVTAQRSAADNDENLLVRSLSRSVSRPVDEDESGSPARSPRRRARSPRTAVSIRDLMAPGEIKRTVGVDYVSENARSISAASESVAVARRSELLATYGPSALSAAELLRTGKTSDTLGLEPPGGQVFLYSSQKRNTGEWACVAPPPPPPPHAPPSKRLGLTPPLPPFLAVVNCSAIASLPTAARPFHGRRRQSSELSAFHWTRRMRRCARPHSPQTSQRGRRREASCFRKQVRGRRTSCTQSRPARLRSSRSPSSTVTRSRAVPLLSNARAWQLAAPIFTRSCTQTRSASPPLGTWMRLLGRALSVMPSRQATGA